MTSNASAAIDILALARRFSRLFPHLDARTGAVAVTLYRLLARGAPVRWAALAESTGLEESALREIVGGWPGVYEEPGGLTGFGGLSVRDVSPHTLRVPGPPPCTLHARCAWDTLFLPGVLDQPAEVRSLCGETGKPVRLTVTPAAVTYLEPPSTVLSMVEPREAMVADLTQHF